MPVTSVSPADLVRVWLVQRKLVLQPQGPNLLPYAQLPQSSQLVCFVSSMPDSYDECVLIRDVMAKDFGRSQRSTKELFHLGLQVMVRTLQYPYGYQVSQLLSNTLVSIYQATIALDGNDHYINSIYRVGSIIPMGEELGKKRQLFSMNFRVAPADAEPQLG